MKKILLATRDQSDTTSFLRAWGAFTTKEISSIIEPCPYPNVMGWENDWTFFFRHDIIYLHRPNSHIDEVIINRAKLLGIPLWVDLDDDLQNVPESNSCYRYYMNKATQDVVELAIKEADVLTVGGETHAKRLRDTYKREVTLIPNALDNRLLSLKKPHVRNKRIAWRGSDSHQIDLVAFQEQILRLLREYPDWQWFFFGRYPLILQHEKYDNVKWGPEINLAEYYVALTHFNAEIHIVPMLDNVFNRVKSNLSWSDATLAGSVAVVPDFEEFQRPGCFTYTDKANFYNHIRQLMDRERNDQKFHDDSWEWIKENILMSKVNEKRIEIIKNL